MGEYIRLQNILGENFYNSLLKLNAAGLKFCIVFSPDYKVLLGVFNFISFVGAEGGAQEFVVKGTEVSELIQNFIFSTNNIDNFILESFERKNLELTKVTFRFSLRHHYILLI